MTDVRTAVSPRTAGALTGAISLASVERAAGSLGQRATADGGRPLRLYLVLLFGIPAELVVGPLGGSGAPANLLAILLFLLWAASRLIPDVGVAVGRQPMRRAVYCWLFAVLLSYTAGMSRPIEVLEINNSDRGMLNICAWAGLMFLAMDGVRTRESLDDLLRFLVGCGVFLAALGVVQFTTGWNPVGSISIPGLKVNHPFGELSDRSIFVRVQGTALHPIEFGVVLSLVLPFALHFAWLAPPGRRLRAWGAVCLIGAALPMTIARSAIVASGVGILVLLLLWPARQRRAMLMMLPVFAVVMRVTTPGLLGTIRSLFTNIQNDPSTAGRTSDYAAVGHYVAGAPLFGRGVATFMPQLYRTLDNAYLGWLVETGIVGVIAFLALMLTAVSVALAVRSRSPYASPTRDLAACCVASVLAGLVSFGTFDALSFPICSGVFFLVLGSTGALWRLEVAERSRVRSGPSAVAEVPSPRARLRRTTLTASLVVAAAALVSVPPLRQSEYAASSSLILREKTAKGTNPFNLTEQYRIPLLIAIRTVTSPAVVSKLAAQGHGAEYVVVAGDGSTEPMTDQLGSGPLVHVVAHSKDPAQAVDTMKAATSEFEWTLTQEQTAAGSPAQSLISASLVASDTIAEVELGSRSRSVLGAVAVAVALASLLNRSTGLWVPRRRRSRAPLRAKRAG